MSYPVAFSWIFAVLGVTVVVSDTYGWSADAELPLPGAVQFADEWVRERDGTW